MQLLYTISVYIHILSAMIWVGGMAFLGLVVLPAVKKPPFKRIATTLIQRTGVRFRSIGRVNFLLSLVVVFLAVMLVRGVPW